MDIDQLLRYREEADAFFKSHPQSPLTPEQQAVFSGLDWFPPDPALEFEITAEEFAEKESVVMPRSSDKKPPATYQKWGRLHFEIAGQAVSLLLLYSAEHDHFFLGFWDATSGHESYAGGRYLEPQSLGGGRFRVDFNRAYNPYCAYNDRWSCIIPPAENRLPVRVEAGQKAFNGAGH